MSDISTANHRINVGARTTTGTERFRSQLQEAKQARQNNLLNQNLDLVRENSRLRKQIAYHEARTKPLLLFYYRYLEMQEMLQSMAQEFKQIRECEAELIRELGINIEGKHSLGGGRF